MMLAKRIVRVGFFALLAAGLLAAPAAAQLDLEALNQGPKVGANDAPPVTVKAQFVAPSGDWPAMLLVTADIAKGWHIYSVTQKKGGPVPSKIKVDDAAGHKLIGAFKPSEPPLAKVEPAFGNLEVETHEGSATWAVPIEFAAGSDAATLTVTGKFSYQACNDAHCLPPTTIAFAAKEVDRASVAKLLPTSPPGVYKPNTAHVTIRGHVEPRVVEPGGKVRLVLTAEPSDGYHIYPWADKEPKGAGPRPTLISVNEPVDWKSTAPTIAGDLVEKDSADAAGGKERYYEKPVTWTIEIAVPKDAKPGPYNLAGGIGFQTCLTTAAAGGSCDFPQGARFQVELPVAEKSAAGRLLLGFAAGKTYNDAASPSAGKTAGVGFDATKLRAAAAGGSESLALMLGAALLGGLILNCMPCVLPVIGIKILGFVQQSQHDHRRILVLNLWFTLGLLSVFAALASMAVFLNLGWGEQFTKPWFTIGMAGLVFVMALSFLGVWEIPIPGFVGGSSASELATREGAIGAFAKGAFTTLLATPCSGPFLGPLFGILLRQPPAVTYAVFMCVGLGMASPYLLIALFPSLIRFLPRPGPWMDTFKQLMGFVLLATVVFLFMSIKQDLVVPTFGLLIGLWFGCWWAGRTPVFAEFGTRIRSWGIGTAFAAAVGWFAFAWLVPGNDVLPWQPYSRASLVELTSAGKTVFVDFTADWCLTCKRNERMAINTRAVRDLVDRNRVVPLKADWTDGSPEIKEMLNLLGSDSIPVYAIFPADRPNRPIVFRDLVTQRQVLERLREAGPSKEAAPLRTARLPE